MILMKCLQCGYETNRKIKLCPKCSGLMQLEKKHKHNATPCYQDDIYFPSKLERLFYSRLKIMQHNGEIDYFLCQVPFRIGAKRKYVCDFLIFWSGGDIQYVDAKGQETEMFKLKKDLTEAKYPVRIYVFKKWEDLCQHRMLKKQQSLMT